MARHRTTGAGSGAGRTQLIYATAIHLPSNPSSALNLANAKPRLRPLNLVVRETEFCGLRLAGDFGRRTAKTVGIRFADRHWPGRHHHPDAGLARLEVVLRRVRLRINLRLKYRLSNPIPPARELEVAAA